MMRVMIRCVRVDGHEHMVLGTSYSSVWVSRPLIEGVTILYSFAAVHHNPLMLVYICMCVCVGGGGIDMWQGGALTCGRGGIDMWQGGH